MIRLGQYHVFNIFVDLLSLECSQRPIGHPLNKDRGAHVLDRKLAESCERFSSTGDIYWGLLNLFRGMNSNPNLDQWFLTDTNPMQWEASNGKCWAEMLADESTDKPAWMDNLWDTIRRPEKMSKLLQQAFTAANYAHHTLHCFHDWKPRHVTCTPMPYSTMTDWHLREPRTLKWNEADFENQDSFLWQKHHEFTEEHRLDPGKEEDRKILEAAGFPHQPLFVAVDGGAIQHDDPSQRRASASVTLFTKPQKTGNGTPR